MSIYYQDDYVTLYHGDWRETIAEDFRADLIVTDPPYGETSLEWDIWPSGWPALAARHADSMWCFGSMRMFLDRRDDFAAWRLSQDVVWEKHNGSGFASDRFKRVHEHALHWYRGPWDKIHADTPRTATGDGRKSVRRNPPPPHTGKIGAYSYTDDGLRLARSVMRAQSMQGRNPINETEKPVGILEPLIRYGCPPDGTVLDLYAGSGSTLAAAKAIGLKAAGFELRESQCEGAARRLSQGVLDFGDAS